MIPNDRSLVFLLALASACSESPSSAPSDAGRDAPGDIVKRDVATDAPAPLPTIEGLEEVPDENPDPRVVEVRLRAGAAEAQLAPGALTQVLAFNGRTPGPLIHARVGDRVIIHFRNDLDEETTIHWHGLRIPDAQDGSPRIQNPVPPGGEFAYSFVVPDPGTFWYHSHVNVVRQIERGLYGALVVHENPAPAFNVERVFVLDDVKLGTNNQIAQFLTSGPDIGRGRLGNRLLCNGAATPCEVTARRGAVERWRVVNAANARSFDFTVRGASWRIIATDGGILPEAFVTTGVNIAPGQRYDIEVRHDDPAAATAELVADIPVLLADGGVGTREFPLISAAHEGEVTPIEPVYPTVTLPSIDAPDAGARSWLLSGGVTDAGVEFTINGQSGAGHNHGLTDTFRQGEPVRIQIVSRVSPEHPFHLHGQFFQIVERGRSPVTDEPGLRDTVLVRGNEPVTILTYFENPGQWMFHCHISEHSELGMMGELTVVPRMQR